MSGDNMRLYWCWLWIEWRHDISIHEPCCLLRQCGLWVVARVSVISVFQFHQGLVTQMVVYWIVTVPLPLSLCLNNCPPWRCYRALCWQYTLQYSVHTTSIICVHLITDSTDLHVQLVSLLTYEDIDYVFQNELLHYSFILSHSLFEPGLAKANKLT